MSTNEQIERLMGTFREVNKSYMKILRKDTEALGTTVMQTRVMRIIKRNPNIGVLELAERLHLGNSTISSMVDRLVKSGLVERERLSSDRRSKTLRLTEKGEQVQNKADQLFLDHLSSLLENIPEEEMEHLIRTLNKISKILGERDTNDGEDRDTAPRATD
ncbi:MarR family winged helix-turn-helix transcriptional regulator [Marinicrinis lubricantis]|uniref:MarR family winged helix-turn-helix transcriptional regulator n=1 Tax=Marinicrinis lubricantis TaxID=2086470 RepID=A0ABW1IUE9_9BACL